MQHSGTDILIEALRLTTAMADEENIMVLLRRGLELCTGVLGCERGFLIAEDQVGRRKIIERSGMSTDNESYSTTALKLVNEKQEPLLISDTIDNELLNVQESIQRNDIRSVLCTLIKTEESSLDGKSVYLYLDSRTDRHPLSMDDLERFKLLTGLMGSLIRKSEIHAQQEATIQDLRNKMDDRLFDDLVFGSDTFRKCLTLIKQGAPSEVPVMLLGETGTGKERLAKIVHDLSPRKDMPFLAVNCGAIPANLMESQLFGHEKGAFTGAIASRKGYFEECDGGTLFLDEIGEVPLQVQTQFLRALQEGEILRVGSSKPIHVNVRIVAATNVDLEKAVEEGRFRKDLFYRLNVLPVTIPPVRDRAEDSLLLAKFFLTKYSQTHGSKQLAFSREAEKSILVYDWPGNVREIQNKIQRAVITCSGTTIGPDDLSLNKKDSGIKTLREAREAVDRELITAAMKRCPGNLTNAGKILDIDRKSLRILLEKYKMNCSDTDPS